MNDQTHEMVATGLMAATAGSESDKEIWLGWHTLIAKLIDQPIDRAV
jgi:hypothetical protein